MIKHLTIMMIVVAGSINSHAVETVPTNGKVHYSAGKDVNFDELLIQGQLKRPDISVVTGNVKQGDDGLLRLRENFLDRVTSDAGEESKE